MQGSHLCSKRWAFYSAGDCVAPVLGLFNGVRFFCKGGREGPGVLYFSLSPGRIGIARRTDSHSGTDERGPLLLALGEGHSCRQFR